MRCLRTLLSVLAATLLCAGSPLSARGADLPALPFPAAPPSSTQVLAGQLVAELLTGGAGEAVDFGIAIRFDTPPARARVTSYLAYVADSVEAAIRKASPRGQRVASDDPRAAERYELVLRIEQGHIAATGKRVRVPSHVWERLKTPAGRVVGTAFTSVRVDLEVRTLLGLGRRQVKLNDLRVVPIGKVSLAALGDDPILDLLVADLDGDREPELAVLTADRVRILRWVGAGFTEQLGSFGLTGVPPSAGRLRQPLGRLVAVPQADGRRVLVAASSERSGPSVLTWDGTTVAAVPNATPRGWPLYAQGVDEVVWARWPRGTDVLRHLEVGPVVGAAVAPVALGSAKGVYDVRAFAVRAAATPGWNPHVMAASATGELLWREGEQPGATRTLADRGVVATISDLDADGTAELLTTSTALSGADRLTLYRLDDGGRPAKTLWRGTAPAPVTAATTGDVDRDGYDELVVATWDGQAGGLFIVLPRLAR